MGQPLSKDLRKRALAAVDAGESRRRVAKRFGVSASSVIRRDAVRRSTGCFAPKAQGGGVQSSRIEDRCPDMKAVFEEDLDPTLEELRGRLDERGVAASTSSLSRFFQRNGITRKRGRPRERAGSAGCPEQTTGMV